MRQRGDAVRRAVRQVHLWLGLLAGALFVLLGLTGTALAFYPQVDALLHPSVRVEGQRRPTARNGTGRWPRCVLPIPTRRGRGGWR